MLRERDGFHSRDAEVGRVVCCSLGGRMAPGLEGRPSGTLSDTVKLLAAHMGELTGGGAP